MKPLLMELEWTGTLTVTVTWGAAASTTDRVKSHLTWDLAQGQVGIQPVIVTWEASACWQRKGQPWEPTWTQSRTRGAGEGAGWSSTQTPRQGGSGRAPWRSHPPSDRGLCPQGAVLWVEIEKEYNASNSQTHSPRIGKQHHVGESRVILSANAVVCDC